ncbi:MAG: substrate-binding domain-containing protein [Planctomycetes bacterium]|nr:substrate-binding domain-containing protein [Planctomycetota bacterium]
MKPAPVVQTVYNLLLRRMASRDLPPGSRCPSIRELARDLKMSPPPIHAAIRAAARDHLLEVHPRRRAVVLPGADKRASRLLAEGHAATECRRLAVLIPEEYFPLRGAPFHNALARTVTRAADQRGWQCRVVRVTAKEPSRQARKIVRQFDAAFVIEPSPMKLAILFTLAEHGFPMLSFNRQIPGIDMPVLTTDDYGASRQLGRLMASHGHKNICLFATPKHAYMEGPRSSISGWLDFLDETGLIETCTIPVFYHKTSSMVPLLLERLLNLHPPITGFVFDVPPDLAFVGSDERFRDLRIPDHVSVAGMSSVAGIPWPSRHPPVTSFEVDWPRAGHCAVEMIDHLLSGDRHPKSIRVPLNILLTESIGPVPTADRPLVARKEPV